MVDFINILHPYVMVLAKQAKLSVLAAMQCFQNALAYFATAVSYVRKMFMKSTPVVNVIKLFTAISYNFS